MASNMKYRKYLKSTPPDYTPKFREGQRVRISEEGVKCLIAKKGTMGTVQHCGLVVQVLVDGCKEIAAYWPDYWDAA